MKTGLDYADGRRGYRMVQDEAYGREVKESGKDMLLRRWMLMERDIRMR